MKRQLFGIIALLIFAMPSIATEKDAAKEAVPDTKKDLTKDTITNSQIRSLYLLVRHKQQKDYISAMEDATLLLSQNEKNIVAKNHIHNNWDKMVQQVNSILDKHSATDDIEESMARLKVYEQLTRIEDNLRCVTMPLKGTNWVWQPEMLYTQGTYDAERQHLMSLYRQKAAEALRSYDTETARLLYDQALHSTVLLPQEIAGQRRLMRDDINSLMKSKANRYNIHELLFAYELCSLSLFLDQDQAEIRQEQERLQTDICRRYEDLAKEALQAGDSIRAEEYRTSALDWKTAHD